MNTRAHADFDRRMRALHAEAVAQVPARTLYQLRVRAAASARGPVPAPGQDRAKARTRPHAGWWLAAASAAVFALALGLRDPAPLPSVDDTLPPLASVAEAANAAEFEDGLAALEEDPDLYVWLASQDGLILAME